MTLYYYKINLIASVLINQIIFKRENFVKKSFDYTCAKKWFNKISGWTKNLTLLIFLLTFTSCADFDKPLIPMEKIPGGTFTMGSPITESGRDNNPGAETPHQVTVSSFYMSKYTITQEQYEAVMKMNLSFSETNLPVRNVGWEDAVDFCNELSKMEGLKLVYPEGSSTIIPDWNANGYRLPTEAEWEYACRAGTTTRFYTGEDITTDQANYDNPHGVVAPVGSFKPNRWGLYDMHGNVYEWCWDCYDDYSTGPEYDPTGPSPSGSGHVVRGGSWESVDIQLRSANRANQPHGSQHDDVGFRVVRR